MENLKSDLVELLELTTETLVEQENENNGTCRAVPTDDDDPFANEMQLFMQAINKDECPEPSNNIKINEIKVFETRWTG